MKQSGSSDSFRHFFYSHKEMVMKTQEEIDAEKKANAKLDPRESGKGLPKGLLDAVKQDILDNNGQLNALKEAIDNAKTQKDKDALTKVLERTTKAMNELKESDLKIIKQTDNRFVVDAGKYGYRKVTL